MTRLIMFDDKLIPNKIVIYVIDLVDNYVVLATAGEEKTVIDKKELGKIIVEDGTIKVLAEDVNVVSSTINVYDEERLKREYPGIYDLYDGIIRIVLFMEDMGDEK